MLVRRALQPIRHLIPAPLRRGFRSGYPNPRRRPIPRPEFPQVNKVTGVEPLKPDLSGLQLQPVRAPPRITRLLIEIAYRWHPSREYRRRQAQMRRMNRDLKRLKGEGPPPPVFLYPEESDLSPARIQPNLDLERHRPRLLPSNKPPRDLRDLEAAARPRKTWMLGPLLQTTDPDYFRLYRSFLPRRYRNFLLHSPYPRIVAAIVLSLGAFIGTMWVTQLQQAEALALGRYTLARHAYQAELDGALAYGVAPSALAPLRKHATSLQRESAPSGIIPTGARLRFYRAETSSYTSLRRAIRRLEHQALVFWNRRAGVTYGLLAGATDEAKSAGLQVSLPPIPACSTARCYQHAVASESARASWLRTSVTAVSRYTVEVQTSADPAGAAATDIQALRNLQGILPRAAVPAPIPELDGAYATASGAADYGRTGALAHLDIDTLGAALVHTLPARAIVVSMEDATMTCYDHGRIAYRSAVSAGPNTPAGIFHIQARESSIAATYWRRATSSYGYNYGSIPLWMPFSGDAALQGAPWRLAFGPGSAGAVTAYAPSTPASVDLPMDAASYVFHWATTGTEVVVY